MRGPRKLLGAFRLREPLGQRGLVVGAEGVVPPGHGRQPGQPDDQKAQDSQVDSIALVEAGDQGRREEQHDQNAGQHEDGDDLPGDAQDRDGVAGEEVGELIQAAEAPFRPGGRVEVGRVGIGGGSQGNAPLAHDKQPDHDHHGQPRHGVAHELIGPVTAGGPVQISLLGCKLGEEPFPQAGAQPGNGAATRCLGASCRRRPAHKPSVQKYQSKETGREQPNVQGQEPG